MDREQARQTIRREVSCADFLTKSKSGSYNCPFCGSGTHKNGTGALKVYNTNTWTCHACGKSGDVIDLFQETRGVDYNKAIESLADMLGLSIDRYSPGGKPRGTDRAPGKPKKTAGEEEPANYMSYYTECRGLLCDLEPLAYLSSRGISLNTAEAYWLGYDPKADPANAPGAMGDEYKPHPCPRIIIPTSLSHYVGRRIDGNKQFAKSNAKGSKPAIFNGKALDKPSVKEIFVVEGAFDALSILEVGYTAIALNSTSNVSVLLGWLEKRRTAAKLILCPDNDSDPKTAQRTQKKFNELGEGLRRLNVSFITADINCGMKDANEALVKDRQRFKETLEKVRQQGTAHPDGVQYYIETLMSKDLAAFRETIKTGFPNLDDTCGGLYSGLYVVAAISSLGKTTFCHQMADQIAAGGHDVLFFSLEQSRFELVTKSIARWIAREDFNKRVTSLSIRRGYLPDVVVKATEEYAKAVENRLSIVEGNFACNISFIGDYIRDYVKCNNGSRPVVFIDYLQILQPGETDGRRQTTREVVDTTVTELKRLSRELDLTIFVVSSVNRSNYLTPIDFESLKESGGIEYTADVVWGLQLQCLNDDLFSSDKKIKEKRQAVKEAKKASPREIELVCLKNRYGVSSYSCQFDYYPASDYFRASLPAENYWENGALTSADIARMRKAGR